MKTVVAAALGECGHVAGVMSFPRLTGNAGRLTVFLGPAVPVERVLAAAQQERTDLAAVSYGLTPESGERLLGEFAEVLDDLRSARVRFPFGRTPPVAERARSLSFFERVFDGSEPVEEDIAYLKQEGPAPLREGAYPQTVLERMA